MSEVNFFRGGGISEGQEKGMEGEEGGKDERRTGSKEGRLEGWEGEGKED